MSPKPKPAPEAEWKPSKRTDWRKPIAFDHGDLNLPGFQELPARGWTRAEVEVLDRAQRELLGLGARR